MNGGLNKMPCEKYESKKQRALCFATDEWKNWSRVKLFNERSPNDIIHKDLKVKVQTGVIKFKGGKYGK